MATRIIIHPRHRMARSVQRIHLNVETDFSPNCLLIPFWGQRMPFPCFLLFLKQFAIYFLASSRKRRKGNGSGSSNQEPQPKNAVAILNELKKNLVYELESQDGPYHAPIFTMSVVVRKVSSCPCKRMQNYLRFFFASLHRLTVKSMLVRESRRSWHESTPPAVPCATSSNSKISKSRTVSLVLIVVYRPIHYQASAQI